MLHSFIIVIHSSTFFSCWTGGTCRECVTLFNRLGGETPSPPPNTDTHTHTHTHTTVKQFNTVTSSHSLVAAVAITAITAAIKT